MYHRHGTNGTGISDDDVVAPVLVASILCVRLNNVEILFSRVVVQDTFVILNAINQHNQPTRHHLQYSEERNRIEYNG